MVGARGQMLLVAKKDNFLFVTCWQAFICCPAAVMHCISHTAYKQNILFSYRNTIFFSCLISPCWSAYLTLHMWHVIDIMKSFDKYYLFLQFLLLLFLWDNANVWKLVSVLLYTSIANVNKTNLFTKKKFLLDSTIKINDGPLVEAWWSKG